MELSPSSSCTQLAHALQGVRLEDKELSCSVPVTPKCGHFVKLGVVLALKVLLYL